MPSMAWNGGGVIVERFGTVSPEGWGNPSRLSRTYTRYGPSSGVSAFSFFPWKMKLERGILLSSRVL